MANLLDIQRRIRSVSNTRQITRAMKLVAAARLRRAQERALSARPYEQMLVSVLKSLVSRADVYDPQSGEPLHPLLAERVEKNSLLIVISSDRGLAGAFDSNIARAALRFVNQKAELGLGVGEAIPQDGGASRMQGSLQRIEVQAVGRKGREFFRRRLPLCEPDSLAHGICSINDVTVGMNKINLAEVNKLSERVIDRYTKGEIDSVYLAFNEFKSVIAQRVIVDKLLPIREIGETNIQHAEEPTEKQQHRAVEASRGSGARLFPADTRASDERSAQFATADVDYIYEQPPQEIFHALLPKYVSVEMFRAVLESVAAEQAARMTAMDSATNNANEMTDRLTLSMNRARQAKITTEIIEIVSGAAAQ
jgi:F-type H+-transporting ATPase subunit gamma